MSEREEEQREAAATAAPAYEVPERRSTYMSETARAMQRFEGNSYKNRVGHRGRAERQGYPNADTQTIPNPMNGGNPITVSCPAGPFRTTN